MDEFEAPKSDCSAIFFACWMRCMRSRHLSHQAAAEGVGDHAAAELRRHAQPQTVADMKALLMRWSLPNMRLPKTYKST